MAHEVADSLTAGVAPVSQDPVKDEADHDDSPGLVLGCAGPPQRSQSPSWAGFPAISDCSGIVRLLNVGGIDHAFAVA